MTGVAMSHEPLRLVSLSEHAASGADAIAQVTAWSREFLMNDHPELGRGGNVCPFAALGARLNTLRFAASDASARETDRIRRELRSVVAQFDEIPFVENSRLYRAILVAFPECAGSDGLAALGRAQKSLRLVSFFRARMIRNPKRAACGASISARCARPCRWLRSVLWLSPTPRLSCAIPRSRPPISGTSRSRALAGSPSNC
jgi:hypothetical protein